MADPKITWTAPGTAVTRTLEFGRGLSRLDGGQAASRRTTVSTGGIPVTVIDDAWYEYIVEVQGIGPRYDGQEFGLLAAWWSHASRGGLFDFAVDGAQTAETLANGAITVEDTSITVDSTSGMSAGDWLLFEDADDPTICERKQIAVVDSSTALTLTYEIDNSYVDNSVIRHAEFFPDCICLDSAQPFRERTAGQGPYWDLRFLFRTTR